MLCYKGCCGMSLVFFQEYMNMIVLIKADQKIGALCESWENSTLYIVKFTLIVNNGLFWQLKYLREFFHSNLVWNKLCTDKGKYFAVQTCFDHLNANRFFYFFPMVLLVSVFLCAIFILWDISPMQCRVAVISLVFHPTQLDVQTDSR